jgi:hypothetical protein
MMQAPTAIERAFSLARSGSFRTMTTLKQQLRLEGFREEQLRSNHLRKQLVQLMQAAKPDSPCATVGRVLQTR